MTYSSFFFFFLCQEHAVITDWTHSLLQLLHDTRPRHSAMAPHFQLLLPAALRLSFSMMLLSLFQTVFVWKITTHYYSSSPFFPPLVDSTVMLPLTLLTLRAFSVCLRQMNHFKHFKSVLCMWEMNGKTGFMLTLTMMNFAIWAGQPALPQWVFFCRGVCRPLLAPRAPASGGTRGGCRLHWCGRSASCGAGVFWMRDEKCSRKSSSCLKYIKPSFRKWSCSGNSTLRQSTIAIMAYPSGLLM